MLPTHHRQHYEEFKQSLEQFSRMLSQDAGNAAQLKSAVAELKHWFQTQIVSISLDDLTASMAHQVRSYQVEMDKQLRLLSMDVMFLQAARQAETSAQRQAQVYDRLNTLIRYCEALLKET